jgi:hypothetical protein
MMPDSSESYRLELFAKSQRRDFATVIWPQPCRLNLAPPGAIGLPSLNGGVGGQENEGGAIRADSARA